MVLIQRSRSRSSLITNAKIVVVCFLILLWWLRRSIQHVEISRQDAAYRNKKHSSLSQLPRNENDGFCRESIESAEFILNQKENSFWNVHMIQLVGRYTGKKAFLTETMEQDYLHNKQMLRPHQIESTPIREPVEDLPNGMSPAFWKIDAIKYHCTSFNYDLVLFLDGDALIMDPYSRVEFLWEYHTELARKDYGTGFIDMLFNGDRNELNSGVFIVNCTSKTAIKTLEIWKDVSLFLARNTTKVVHQDWYEQNALHLMMRTRTWTNHGTLRWNDILSNYTDDPVTYSTKSLRQRIRMTTQCALNTYVWERFGERNHSERFVYKPGHYILHMAGVPARQKHALLAIYRNSTKPSTKSLTLREAARLYLKFHSFRIDRTLAYEDWKIVLDWNHVWPEARH